MITRQNRCPGKPTHTECLRGPRQRLLHRRYSYDNTGADFKQYSAVALKKECERLKQEAARQARATGCVVPDLQLPTFSSKFREPLIKMLSDYPIVLMDYEDCQVRVLLKCHSSLAKAPWFCVSPSAAHSALAWSQLTHLDLDQYNGST